MPTSSYMPDVMVEVDFSGSGFSTPDADRTWTDISEWVELEAGLEISWGRGDERSAADANQLRLVLDNSDGRFTAGRATSPYYPNVKLDRPIRVTATPVGGSPSVRFVGFVNEWPVEWDGTDAYARATITASSRLARLGAVSALRSVVETEILLDGPVAYYTLGDTEAATSAADSSGFGNQPLTQQGSGADVAFGQATGPGTDGLTAADFTGGKYLTRGVDAVAAPFTVEFFMLRNGLPATGEGLWNGRSQGSYLALGASGEVAGGFPAGTLVSSPTSVCDGSTHHIALTVTSGAVELFVDGVSVDSASGAPAVALSGDMTIGYSSISGTVLNGVMAHFAVFDSVLSDTAIARHAAAGLTAFEGDTTDERFERYATYAGIDLAEVVAEAGSTTMQHVDSTDRAPVELMRVAETTEGGVLFDGRDGTLQFHNRAHRYEATSLFTLDMGKHEVEADFSPKMDRSALLNDVTVTDVSGRWSARSKDDDSRADYGIATGSVETASTDDDEPLQVASWQVYVGKEPRIRVPSLSVQAVAQADKAVDTEAILAAGLGDKITVSNQPSQMDYAQADYFIEGGSESWGLESCVVTWNVSPSSPWDQTLIVGDALRGVVGTHVVAY